MEAILKRTFSFKKILGSPEEPVASMLKPAQPAVLEVDYHENITDLYKAITESDWDAAINAVKKNPAEARTWVVRKHDKNPEKHMWRFLPIHSACAREPPANLITALIAAYPEGPRCVDDQGMYALHYAAGNQASRYVMRSLLMAFPDAAKLKDPRGMLPIHYLACWGPSSISVVDMVMVANRNIEDTKDEDGNTPMDLAKSGDYPEKNAVVTALKRWSSANDGDQPTLLTSPSHNSVNLGSIGYKVVGSRFQSLTLGESRSEEEKKCDDSTIDDLEGMNCLSPGTVKRITVLDDQISVMEIEKKEDQHEITSLQHEMKLKDQLIEKLQRELSMVNDECVGLRNTLADITEQHEGLAGMNSNLLSMVEQQEVVLEATRTREEQWETLAGMRREKLRELVQMEEEDTFQEVDLRNTLAKQAHEMAAIKAEMTTTLGGKDSANDSE
mmetsp:Transcript_838/g.1957  ORF Transcript_838/g.1957 Transcript_838/m.1957 type:complete len:444 (-) Transcript_838:197-1528(-)